MRLSDSVRAIADATGQPFGRVNTVARRLQEIGSLPLGPGGRIAADIGHYEVALILLALLVRAPAHIAVRIAVDVAEFTRGGMTAQDWLVDVIEMAERDEPASITMHSTSHANVLEISDGFEQHVFTKDGLHFDPHAAGGVVASFTLSGILVRQLSARLRELS